MLADTGTSKGSAVPEQIPAHGAELPASLVSGPGSRVSPLLLSRVQQAGGVPGSPSAAAAHGKVPSERGTSSKAASTRERKGLPFVLGTIMAIAHVSSTKGLRPAWELLRTIRLEKGGATGGDALINTDHRD